MGKYDVSLVYNAIEKVVTTTLGSYQGNTVEKLVFYNHTECECQDKKEDLMPRDPAKSSDFSTRHYRHPGNTARMDPYGPAPLRSSRIDRTPDPPPTNDCKCPSLFSVRHPSEPNESCTCDCFDKQQDCIRAKRGKEYFSLQDRLCIQSEECVMPECEFGIYLRRAGRCPRKREKLAAFHRYSPDEYK
ncbi:hypothetical protein J437_LFUL002557 [Ladona fulva]|uniref:Vascular endothelial growth factor n=1 Tax=Ladona fulva TaxID=123851 RepID=A0A8K0JUV4_LADFU|nr:hypothetical protein J437_LFUL002557 [Ladona fulva]